MLNSRIDFGTYYKYYLICNMVTISYNVNAEMVMDLYVALSLRNVATERTTVFYNKDHIFSQIQNL